MISTYTIWQYVHIVLFAYWLGADLGVFFASRYVARADLSLPERLRFLELLLLIDIGPRTALILMVPVGSTLALKLGLAPFLSGWLWLVWLLSLAWLALAWWLFAHARDPKAAPLVRFDSWVRWVVAAMFVAMGVASFARLGPVEAGWLAAKFITFGFAVVLGLLLRRVIRDWVIGFAQLRQPATEAAGNALIYAAHHRAHNLALALWVLVALTAFLGVTKPGLGLS
ncbi:MAG: hypothetical protein KDI32_04955 [Pseudomonadales bacterium]|nr:hypothetical protein [Pseudomonadales bacterium]